MTVALAGAVAVVGSMFVTVGGVGWGDLVSVGGAMTIIVGVLVTVGGLIAATRIASGPAWKAVAEARGEEAKELTKERDIYRRELEHAMQTIGKLELATNLTPLLEAHQRATLSVERDHRTMIELLRAGITAAAEQTATLVSLLQTEVAVERERDAAILASLERLGGRDPARRTRSDDAEARDV